MKSTAFVSQKQATVPGVNIPRSQFDLSNTIKNAQDVDYLVPLYNQEVLPGDTHNIQMHGFARLSSPLFPFMDNLFASVYWFFVPNRLIWTNFKKMMGEQDNPGDSVDYTIPQITAATGANMGGVGELYDCYDVPVGNITTAKAINNLLPRGYNLIWNSWFRDENLQNAVTVDTGDGPDTNANYRLLKKNKMADMFTSCLPWPQKTGATEVLIPIGTTAPVTGIGIVDGQSTNASAANVWESDASAYRSYAGNWDGSTGQIRIEGQSASTAVGTSNLPQIYADLANGDGATMNQLRYASAVQVLYERDARGGTRYPELVWAHFGVENAGGDARMARPEFLGSSRDQINVNAIASTYDDNTNNTKGDLGAIGTVNINTGIVKSFSEHGFIHALLCFHGEQTYQSGLPKHFAYRDKLDLYWPALAQLGEQVVENSEIYCDGSANDTGTFGYQERDYHHRYKPSSIRGAFRSTASGTLEAWGLWEKFTSLPTLGSTFIQSNTPIDRVLKVTTEPNFIYDFVNTHYAARPLPTYGIPAQLGRF
jgi:hypothetical protein